MIQYLDSVGLDINQFDNVYGKEKIVILYCGCIMISLFNRIYGG